MQSSCIQNHKCKLQLKYKSCVLLFFNKALANTEWQILGLTCCLFSLQLNSVYPMVYAFINRTVPSLWLYFCRAKAIKHIHKTFGVSEKYTSLIFYPTENIMEKAKCFHPKQILCFRFFFSSVSFHLPLMKMLFLPIANTSFCQSHSHLGANFWNQKLSMENLTSEKEKKTAWLS